MAHQRQYTLTASIDVALSLVSCVVPTQVSPCRLIAIRFESTNSNPIGLTIAPFIDIRFGNVIPIWSNYGLGYTDNTQTKVSMSQNVPESLNQGLSFVDQVCKMALPLHLIIDSRHTVKFGVLTADPNNLISNASVVVEPLNGAELEIYLTGLDDE